MNYPSDFKERVKKEFPTGGRLHKKLDTGDVIVGRYLDDSVPAGISPEEVLRALDTQELGSLRTLAKQAIRRKNLYREWYKLYNQQRS